MKNILLKIYEILKSKKLAYLLIILLTLYSITGALLPIILKSSYKNSYFSNPYFPYLVLIFFLNTLVCTIEQGKIAYRFPKMARKSRDIQKMPYHSILADGLDFVSIKNKLRKKGFKVFVIKEKIFAHKGTYSLWGAFIFHLSFLIIIIAVLITLETSFEGKMIINEGEEVVDQKDSYFDFADTPYFNNSFYGFTAKLNKLSIDYPDKGYPTKVSGDLSILKNGVEVERGNTKYIPPFEYGPYSFGINRYGYSPHVVIYKGNENIVDAYTTLQSILTSKNERYYDELDLNPLSMKIEFLPDGKYVVGNRRIYKPIAPAYKINLFEGGNLLYSGIMPQNQKLSIKDYTLIIPDYKKWVEMHVVKDYGDNLLNLGFLIGVIGISIYFLGNYEFIWITINNGVNDVNISDENLRAGYIIGAGTRKRTPFYQEKFEKLVHYLDQKEEI